MQHFYDYLITENDTIADILSNTNEPMRDLTTEEKLLFDNAENCYFCEEKLWVKYRHHDHLSSDFIGVSCNRCNLQMKPRRKFTKNQSKKGDDDDEDNNAKVIDYFLPIICHNSKFYDNHLILKDLKGELLRRQMHVIATNTEQFISFQIGSMRFLDSNQFLSGSLSALVDTLKKDGKSNFNFTRDHFPESDKFDLMTRKGVYPYEYMNDALKFEETELPGIKNFFSKLTNSEISFDDYNHAKRVWDAFEIKNLHEYHDLYLLTDTILLADFFEHFRRFSLENYKLDPVHYYTAPGLSFDACLKMTAVRLELLTDPDMLLFFEKGIRGGVATITNRLSTANNKYLPPEIYDATKPSTFIQYYDANNLYGWAMSQPLPTGRFQFLDYENFHNIDFKSIPHDSPVGYVLEVDLEYPDELHDDHNDLPLAPEKIIIQDTMLSPTQKALKEKMGYQNQQKAAKLTPNFMRKQNYVVHYRNFNFYIEHGMIVTRIHRV